MSKDRRRFPAYKLLHDPTVLSILVIEDDRLALLSLAMFLRLRGYAVHEASDGESAATRLSEMHFDFVISDLHLPGKIDGLDILRLTKSSAHTVGAILISGDGSEQVKEKADALGAVYMEKPIELKEIARIIDERAGKYTS